MKFDDQIPTEEEIEAMKEAYTGNEVFAKGIHALGVLMSKDSIDVDVPFGAIFAMITDLKVNSDRYRKLRRWMGSNVSEGWDQVENMGAVCAWAGWDEADSFLDSLPECNVGMAHSSTPDIETQIDKLFTKHTGEDGKPRLGAIVRDAMALPKDTQ